MMEENVKKDDHAVKNDNNHNLSAVKKKKVKKHDEALRLVKVAKEIVKSAEEETEACKLLLSGDLKEYETAKDSLKKGGMDACSLLLKKLGYSSSSDTKNVEDKILVFEPKDDVPPITLKNVSSGKFTGFIYALFGGLFTAGGLIYLATEQLGITLDISKVPSTQTLENIASWFSKAVGLGENTYIGAGILVLASLLVMVIIYSLRVALKGSKNIKFARTQLKEAEEYTEKKSNCKAEMDKVDVHMKTTIDVLKMYEVLFNEQKGKLERILHIEGSKKKSSDYHEKSFVEIHDTKELLRSIQDFISTPMTKAGKLSEDSVNYLKRAKMQMDKMLERLY